MSDALYIPDGDHFLPTELTRGPWDPLAQHAGAPAALIARAVEQLESPQPMHLARLTIEIIRPVPLLPLKVTAVVTRPGRKVQVSDVIMEAEGVEVCRARAVRIRRADLPVPTAAAPQSPPPGPGDGTPVELEFRATQTAFHTDGMEFVEVGGSVNAPGPATVWLRLRQPVVAGEEPTGVQRAVAAADFGNGVSWVMPMDRYLFINTDLTVQLVREPEGEWICLDAVTVADPGGVGSTESALSDTLGRVGRSLQTLFVDHGG
ncbi:MAG: thioesterase family protein [Actinobacteria bacterium]|nr:thioesterase family protein [Actinomycetota bacterium]